MYFCSSKIKIIDLKNLSKKIIVLFICFLPMVAVCQETKTEKAPQTSKAQKKKAKQKWKEDRKMEMEHAKIVKQHHKRLQTKETRKRMKQEKKKSNKLRENKREFFLIRWFKFRK